MQGAFEVEPCAGGQSGQLPAAAGRRQADRVGQQRQPVHDRRQPVLGQLHRLRRRADPAGRRGPVARPGRARRRASPRRTSTPTTSRSPTPAPGRSSATTPAARSPRWPAARVTALGTGTWHHLSLTLNGHTISGAIDGTTVGTVTDTTFNDGMIGLGVNGYQTDQFDNLSVTRTRLGHADRADHRRRQHGQVRRRQRRTPAPTAPRSQMWDCNGDRRAELDDRDRRHHPDQRLLPGHHRRRDRQRHPGRAVDLQRRRQPAVAAGERDAGQPGVRPVPRRSGVHHDQRHPTGHLGLQRRLEPAVGDPLAAVHPPGAGRPPDGSSRATEA